jgi:hypothetical protein
MRRFCHAGDGDLEGLGHPRLSEIGMQYRSLHKWHIWLGWLIGVPLILWTASGLFMAARPIDDVRGTKLRAEPLALQVIKPVAPTLEGKAIEKLTLEERISGPVWIIQYMGGDARRADPASGAILPGISAREALSLTKDYYTGHAKAASVKRFNADKAPLDLRKERPSWQVAYDDGTHLYIDADSGSFLALRTRYWRIYDFMWGLHIMDLQTREETSHPVLIGFAALSFLALLMAFWMLIARERRLGTKYRLFSNGQ